MHVPQLAQGLKQRGHQVWVAAFPGSPLFNEAKKQGLSVFPFSTSSYFHPKQLVQLTKFIRSQDIQIIHSHFSRDLWTIVPALRWSQSRAGLFLTKHIGTQSPKRDFVHKWLYARVNRLFANSEVIRKNLIETHPVSPKRVETLHLGIDLQRYRPRPELKKPVRRELGIPPNAVVFAIAGRLQRAKGYFEFIQMAEELATRFGQAYFLLIGGASRGEEKEAERIRERAASSSAANRLIFTGFRPDVERILQAADVFVFPSYAEAYGLVVLEAMAVGLPVISSNCDGILDIVLEGVTGELVPPKKARELVRVAVRFIENPKLRERYGRAGLRRIQEEFDWHHMLDKLLLQYELVFRKSQRQSSL